MRNNIIRDSINCLAKAQIEDNASKIARDITLCYLQELEDRIDKAMKFIKEHKSTNPYLTSLLVESEIKEIEKILKGEE